MGVYIDRDELLELYANTDELDISNYDVKVAVIRQNILDMPTIDIIICKECKYYNGHEEYCEIDHFARENGFCSDGKRKTDYTVFTVNPPKGVETSLKGDATTFHQNSKMGEKVARPTATSSTEVPWWIGE